MSEQRTPDGEVGYRVLKVFCRRVERQLSVDEHARCPYCSGDKEKIRTARHEAFCDFKPGEDPINFGFPADRGH